jgi:hypothetical protein
MDNVHFEVHQTLKFDVGSSVDDARAVCDKYNVKLIEVHSISKVEQEILIIDPMTSFRFIGTYKSLKENIQKIEFELACVGVYVFRTKIEIPPHEYIGNLSTVYYESHLQVILNKDKINHEIDRLVSSIPKYAHLSKNAFKSTENGVRMMITLRSKYDLKTLQKRLKYVKLILCKNGFHISDKIEVEKVIYDSNIHHDNVWING